MAKILDHNAAYAKTPTGSQRELEVDASGNLKTTSAGGGSGDGAILDGVTPAIRATVKNYATDKALSVSLTDAAGVHYDAGGGTQYDEDTAHVSGDKVTMAGVVQKSADGALGTDGDRELLQVDNSGYLKTRIKLNDDTVTEDIASAAKPAGGQTMARRSDALSSEVSADRDVIALNATGKGELYIKHTDSVLIKNEIAGVIHIDDNAGSLTVDGPLTDAQLRASAVPVTIPTPTPVTDNAGSLTVDAPLGTPVGVRLSNGIGALLAQQLMAASLPVVIASDQSTIPTQDVADLVDNAAFVDGTSKVLPAGFIYDEVAGSALTENDVAAARLDAKRAQILVIEDAGTRGNRMAVDPTGRITANQGIAGATDWLTKSKIWDGTNQLAITATGRITVEQGAAGLAAWNVAGSVIAAGDVAHDGVDSGNPVKVGGKVVAAAGTPAFVSAVGDRANLAVDGAGRVMITEPQVWTVTHAPAANTVAIASKAAGAAGVKHVLEWLQISCHNSGAATAIMLLVNVRDGATGAGTILMTLRLPVLVTTLTEVNKFLNDLHIVGTAATAMTVEFSAAGGANTNEIVSIGGYDTL